MLVLRALVEYIHRQPVAPTAVRMSEGLWGTAFDEMRDDPRLRELYGVPLAAEIDESNFLLLGIPVICDPKIESGCIAERRQ